MIARITFGLLAAALVLGYMLAVRREPRAEIAAPATVQAPSPRAIQFCNLVLRDGKFYIWPARPDGRCFAQDAKAEHLQK